MTRQTAIQTSQSNQVQVQTPANQRVAHESQPSQWSYIPAIDVIEWEREYSIVCDAPGLKHDEITLTYESGVLNLHGFVLPRYPQDSRFLRQEYGVGDFDRVIPLGRFAEFIDGERISATYESGVLTVHLPKMSKALGRKIEVKAV